MREVDDRPSELVDLVEDVVPEELDDVSVPGLGPARFVVVPVRGENTSEWIGKNGGEKGTFVLGALVDEGELGEEAEEAAVGELGGEGGFEVVDGAVGVESGCK